MANLAVPSIPPLSSISDPNTRAVLQAIVDGQRIRNGDIGDGDEKFLTVADLKGGINGSVVGAGGSGGAFGSVSKGEKSVAAIIQALSDKIMQSRIWKLLDEQITRIETPEWFLGKFGGAIRTEQIIREEQNSALAKQITTAVTNINDNVALVQEELTATSDLAGATASATTQIQTKVGQVDAAAQQALSLAASVDGTVKGTWSVKFDLDGYVAGVALGVDQQGGSPPKSNFVIRADTFAVGAPGAQDTVPFFIEGGATYIKTAMIQQASMDGAYIKDLAVDTIKIKYGAITVPLGQDFGATSGAALYVSGMPYGTPMLVTISWSCPVANTTMSAWNNGASMYNSVIVGGAASCCFTATNTGGAITVMFGVPVNGVFISAIGYKR